MPNPKLDAFFQDQGKTALTFDDVGLEVGLSDFFPNQVDLTTRISRNVKLLQPFVSSAMDTVTEAAMAIAMAKMGGIGSIHRGLSLEDQVAEVDRVKFHIHGLIDKPMVAHPQETVAQLMARREERRFEFDSFPVVDEDNILLGIMSHQDFKRCDDTSLLVRDVMTPFEDLVFESESISKEAAYQRLRETKKNQLPLIDKDRRLVGLYLFNDLKRILAEKPTHNVDSEGRLRVAVAIGTGVDAFERAARLSEHGVDVFHIDTAHGWSIGVLDTVRHLKELYPHIDVIAGNVSSARGALALAEAGADGLLVGQGGGSICTTRRITGIGKPQVTAVYECVKVLRESGYDIPVISDGGIRESGDVVRALVIGASCVMVGNLFAGTDETPGDVITHDGRLYKSYRGMGSLEAMKDSDASRKRYLAGSGALISEGIDGRVDYKGSVADVIEQGIGGVRKGLWYCGAKDISTLQETAELFRVTSSGVTESHPHDVQMVRDQPNYTRRS